MLCFFILNCYFATYSRVSTSPAVFVGTKPGVFKKTFGQCPAIYLATKTHILSQTNHDQVVVVHKPNSNISLLL